jgi:hypothetical protein
VISELAPDVRTQPWQQQSACVPQGVEQEDGIEVMLTLDQPRCGVRVQQCADS